MEDHSDPLQLPKGPPTRNLPPSVTRGSPPSRASSYSSSEISLGSVTRPPSAANTEASNHKEDVKMQLEGELRKKEKTIEQLPDRRDSIEMARLKKEKKSAGQNDLSSSHSSDDLSEIGFYFVERAAVSSQNGSSRRTSQLAVGNTLASSSSSVPPSLIHHNSEQGSTFGTRIPSEAINTLHPTSRFSSVGYLRASEGSAVYQNVGAVVRPCRSTTAERRAAAAAADSTADRGMTCEYGFNWRVKTRNIRRAPI